MVLLIENLTDLVAAYVRAFMLKPVLDVPHQFAWFIITGIVAFIGKHVLYAIWGDTIDEWMLAMNDWQTMPNYEDFDMEEGNV